MSPPDFLDLDVRPLVADKRPPLPAILDAVSRLQAGQTLRLTAPFEPTPLYTVLGREGFHHETQQQKDGSWIILFRR